MAILNFGNFQFNSSKELIFNKKYWNHFQLCQLSIFPTFNLDNFQFWLFSIKIFELIQQQQQHINCMDLAIKNRIWYTCNSTFRETNINFLEKCKVCNLFGQCFKQKLAWLKVESGLGTLALLAFHHKIGKSTECCNIKHGRLYRWTENSFQFF